MPRNIRNLIWEALQDTPVIVINGARQAGKTTPCKALVADRSGSLVTLDDPDTRDAALSDPKGFLEGRKEPFVIDEAQRVPDLLLAIKAAVDTDRRPGRFVLTGSTRFLTVPTLSESLAGRVEIVELWPFSQGELGATIDGFVDNIFSGAVWVPSKQGALSKSDYLQLACAGGFPEVLRRTNPRARRRWFDNYVTTVTQRDISAFSDIRKIAELPRMLKLLAARTASSLNVADLARDAGLKWETTNEYLSLLETVFLIHRLPAWSSNLTSRATKQAKVHIADSGLAAHLLGATPELLAQPGAHYSGTVLETFVVNEVRKQTTWAQTSVKLHHYRDRDGIKVDIVLEAADNRICAVEVKSSGRVQPSDLRGLRLLRERLGPRFHLGVVLYCGKEPRELEDRIIAAPMSTIWTPGRSPGGVDLGEGSVLRMSEVRLFRQLAPGLRLHGRPVGGFLDSWGGRRGRFLRS